jgi:hypothetical protein
MLCWGAELVLRLLLLLLLTVFLDLLCGITVMISLFSSLAVSVCSGFKFGVSEHTPKASLFLLLSVNIGVNQQLESPNCHCFRFFLLASNNIVLTYYIYQPRHIN